MKTLHVFLRRVILFAVLACSAAGVLWHTGAIVWMATKAADLVSQGRVFVDPARVKATTGLGVVLGTSVHGNILKERVRTAAALYRAGKVDHLLLSGDGRSASYNEPRAMRTMLLALGVPKNALIEDAAGLTTYDSIQHALAISQGATLVIVSQPSHCRRALLLAVGMGGDAIGVTAGAADGKTSLSHREQLATVRAVLDLMGLRSLTSALKDARTASAKGVTIAAR